MNLPPPGWYPDSHGTTRYWDGSAWTEHTQAAPAVPSVRPPLFWAAVGGAAGLVIGGFAPWATALGLVSVNGTHGDGWVAILGGLVALGMLFVASQSGKRMNYAVPLSVAGVCAIVAVIDAADISRHSQFVEPGWGLWLVLVSSAVLAGTSIALLTARDTTASAQSAPAERAAPAPGWYPDPQGEGRLRYWNGTMWTPQIMH